ncbi:oligosaccharide flippase family protein [Candidatus Soleaferrea massiliensis]|uniref:oligosaccharide flippase family protein n=1 Tax=Candidatus Soleaferrea massiliensis TaxID=1470354 RepID=UPI00058F9F62|nr:oligosaccharide flippase family protein [Candidatus Soleaferrea massiliensis]
MKVKKEMKTLVSNTVMLYIMQVSGYIFPLLTFPYLTRVLGPEYFGVTTFVSATITYFQLVVDFGFLLSATRDCSLHRDNKQKLQEILSSVVKAKTFIATIAFAGIFILIIFVPQYQEHGLYLALSYLAVFASAFIPDYMFRGIERMSVITYRSVASKALYTVLIFIFVRQDTDYVLIPIFMFAANVFVVIWSFIYLYKKLDIRWIKTPVSSVVAAIKDSAVFFVSRIATTIYNATNVVALGFFFPSAALASFTSANDLITKGRGMFSPIADSIYPYMVKQKNFKLIKKVLIFSFPIILAGTVFLYIFTPEAIRIVCGEGYEGAIPIFRILLFMVPITLPIYLLGFPTLGALNMMKEANLTIVYAAVYHVIGLLILFAVGKFEFIPVAILTVTSEFVVLISRAIYSYLGFKRLERERKYEQIHSQIQNK